MAETTHNGISHRVPVRNTMTFEGYLAGSLPRGML